MIKSEITNVIKRHSHAIAYMMGFGLACAWILSSLAKKRDLELARMIGNIEGASLALSIKPKPESTDNP